MGLCFTRLGSTFASHPRKGMDNIPVVCAVSVRTLWGRLARHTFTILACHSVAELPAEEEYIQVYIRFPFSREKCELGGNCVCFRQPPYRLDEPTINNQALLCPPSLVQGASMSLTPWSVSSTLCVVVRFEHLFTSTSTEEPALSPC